ncbi:MAG: exodeoxyribonuclease VII small subunit [Endomicrobium sp.]|jgi:exodeoxyribonuclease VII small subunit|nr:exodeoxyribonuclease VII small subunit [Endomicrobium sp.]
MVKKNVINSKLQVSEKNFEQSLRRLEEIINDMENADPDLDKALELFTEGLELVHFCSTKLNDAKKRVEILVKKNGAVKKEKFNNDEGEKT